ncbi:MAG TPA: hypothetical protein PK954_13340, partial [Anaerolineales bacterium]|nr:hypothetical protein [Anaerolineales bacterium]
KAEAALAWGTVTAAVATETERPRKEQTAAAIAEENRIATAIAIATADEARRQAEARAKYYGDMAAEGWGKLQVAIPYLLLAFFAIMALMGAGAVLNRIEA